MATDTCDANICIHPGARNTSKVLYCHGGCDRSFHWKCIGVNATIVNACKGNSGLFWICDDCKENSLFVLPRKVNDLCHSVQAIYDLLMRVESNLESKVVTCYTMIQRLATVNSLAKDHALLTRCCHTISEHALDLSLNADARCDDPPDDDVSANTKRKSLDNESDGPSKRSRNLPHSPTADVDDLANLPTPTLSSGHSPAEPVNTLPNDDCNRALGNDLGTTVPAATPTTVSSALHASTDSRRALNDGSTANQTGAAPVTAPNTLLTGNPLSICPVEAGLDTAPRLENFPPLTVPTQSVSTTFPATSTSGTQLQRPLPHSHHPFARTTTTVTTTTGHLQSSQVTNQPPGCTSALYSVPAHVFPGNAMNGVCLAEANSDAAHLNGSPSMFAANAKHPCSCNIGQRNRTPRTLNHQPRPSASQLNAPPAQPARGSQPRSSVRGSQPRPSAPQSQPHGPPQPARGFRANRSPRFNFTPSAQPNNLSLPTNFAAGPTRVDLAPLRPPPQPVLAPPTLQPPPSNPPQTTSKQFYVRPFDPATTAEQVTAYISGKTGWSNDYFSCFRLASTSRSTSRPLSFVSFKILVADLPICINTITSRSFWPDFVSIEPFKHRQRK